MKYRMKLYSLLLLPLLAGCSGTDEPLASGEAEPVEFVLDFGDGQTRSATTLDNCWPANTHIAVREVGGSVLEYQTPSTDSSSGAAVSLSSSGSDYFIWPVTSTTKTFRAWYPYSASEWGSSYDVSVDADQRVDNIELSNISANGEITGGTAVMSDATYNGYDMLYCPDITIQYKKRCPLRFYHQMCRVVVNVNSVATINYVYSVSMGEGNISTTLTLTRAGETGETATDESTKAVWGTATDANNTILMRRTDWAPSRHTAVYECILPPQSGGDFDTALFTLKATTNTKTTSSSDPTYKYKDAFELKAGYQYIYNLSLSKSGVISIATVTVSTWGGVAFDSGDATVPDNTDVTQ